MSCVHVQAQAVHRPIVVAGCVPQGERKLTEIAGLSVVGVQQIDRVVEVVEKTLEVHPHGHTVYIHTCTHAQNTHEIHNTQDTHKYIKIYRL